MPYKRKGKVVYSKGGGSWHVKQRCKSAANAKSAIRLLQMIEHNPNAKLRRRRRK